MVSCAECCCCSDVCKQQRSSEMQMLGLGHLLHALQLKPSILGVLCTQCYSSQLRRGRNIVYVGFNFCCVFCPAGGIYEYTVELASKGAAPCLERRTAKLAGAVAEEMRRNQSSIMEHSPPPGAGQTSNALQHACHTTVQQQTRACTRHQHGICKQAKHTVAS
jgi:hypothetical protein